MALPSEVMFTVATVVLSSPSSGTASEPMSWPMRAPFAGIGSGSSSRVRRSSMNRGLAPSGTANAQRMLSCVDTAEA